MKIYEDAQMNDQDLKAKYFNGLAKAYESKGQYDQVSENYLKAIPIAESDNTDVSQPIMNLGWLKFNNG